MSHDPSTRVCLAIAMCEIEIGTECTVAYGEHYDVRLSPQKTAFDGCQAVIVGFYVANGNVSAIIRMKTGSHAGKIVDDVNIDCLRLSGVFRRVPV